MTALRRAIIGAVAFAALVLSAGAANAVAIVPDGGFVIQGTTPDVKRQIDIAHDAGVRWISLSTTWQELEPAPDSYPAAAWDDLRDRLAYAKSRSMNVELRLANAPAWASGRNAGDDPPTSAHYADYASFLTELGTRLGAFIDAYSPWNEPNRSAFWNPVDPDAFTALQKAAYPGIKAGDPTATVVYGPVVGRYNSQNSGYTFLRRSYELGAKGSFDVIGWNGYPGGPPESDGPVQGGVPAANTLPAQLYLRGLIDQFDPGRKVWILEFGWSTCVSCDVSVANGATEATQADYLTRAFEFRRRYLSDYVERMFWYELRDAGTTRSAWAQNQGVVRADLSPKPALSAFRALGVDVPETPGPGSGTGSTASGGTLPVIPRTSLPTTRSLGPRFVRLGRARLSARKGVLTLVLRVTVRGGATRVKIDALRGRRWRGIASVRVRGTSTLRVRFTDKAFVAVRIRATLPGRKGWRVGRVLRVPVRAFGQELQTLPPRGG